MKKILSVATLFLSSTIWASSFNNIVVFGDSLSDNGNIYRYSEHQIPQSPPYFDGRFSDGNVWIERLAEKKGLGLSDYAFGGAGVAEGEDEDTLFTLKAELQSYLLAHDDKADADNLFFVWIGANNYFGIPEDQDAATTEVVTGIQHSLENLAQKGAKTIVVMDIPDLGRTPAGRLFDAIVPLSQLSAMHNQKLAAMVSQLKANYPAVKWVYIDVNETFSDILDHPEKYQINNVTDTCLDTLNAKPAAPTMLAMTAKTRVSSVASCQGYMFFDPVHPTAPIHELIANEVLKRLQDADVQ